MKDADFCTSGRAGWGLAAWLAVVFVLVVGVQMFRLGGPPLAGTEGHRSLTASQMAQGGSWIVPTLYGRTYLRKPPLHYWTLAGWERLAGGGSTWVWRSPSLVASGCTAMVVLFFAWRWFGRDSGILAGCGFLSMLALWAQNRTADIDAINTFVSTLAACCVLELAFVAGFRTARLVAGLTLAAALTLMLLAKLHAGLPVVGGAMLAAALLTHGRSLRSGWVWTAWVVAVAVFALWVWQVHETIQRLELPRDTSGLVEAGETAGGLWTPSRLGRVLAVPPTLFVFALPWSVGLVVALLPALRLAEARDPGRIPSRAIVLTVLLGWGMLLLGAIVNVRYGYVTLPMLLILGAACVRWMRHDLVGRAALKWTCVLCGFAATAAGTFFAVSAARRGDGWVLFNVALVAMALTCAVLGMISARRDRLVASGVLALSCFALVLQGFIANESARRVTRSGMLAAPELARLVPAEALLEAWEAVFYQPELFFYADRTQVRWVDYRLAAGHVPDPRSWLVLNDIEAEILHQSHGRGWEPVGSFESNRVRLWVFRPNQ